LLAKFGSTNSGKAPSDKKSRHGSVASKVSSNIGSVRSNRSAIGRAGLNISHQGPANTGSQYGGSRRGIKSSHRGSDLNRTVNDDKKVDEWDHIVINDVRQYEEEQKAIVRKRLETKHKIMSDLNAQMQEKRKLHKREVELEQELEQKRARVYEQQDKRHKQQELVKSRKTEDEKRNREKQIAEIENFKRLEKEKEQSQAVNEKKDIEKFLQDEMTRERKKRDEYQQVCQKQYIENMQQKEFLKKQEEQKISEDNMRKNDMFGDMFEKKTHVSYKYAAKNDQKFNALNKILQDEHERKNRIRNIAGFEEGLNDFEHKKQLEDQWKENRLKVNLKDNKKYLQEQINYKKEKSKFERDLEQDLADQMNKKAREELEIEATNQENHRKRRLQNKDELRTQMNFKDNGVTKMTEQERLMNKDKLYQ
jgi:hypothetical protein